MPSFSSGGIVELDFGEMNDLRIDHHCLEDRSLDFSFSARLSLIAFLDSRMAAVILFRICLNLLKSFGSCVLFALRYALLRVLIRRLICYVIQGGSVGRMVTILLGMQVSARFLSLSVNPLAYVLIFSCLSSIQSVFAT